MEGKIRVATRKDIFEIVKLVNIDPKHLLGDHKTGYHYDDIYDYLKNKINRIIIYEENKKILGVFIARFWKNYVSLHSLVINKKYQSKGIGEKLMEYLENLAIKENRFLIELLTEINNKKMQNLLKKRKYKKGDEFLFYNKKLKK